MSNFQDVAGKGSIEIYCEDARQLTALQEIVAKEKVDTVVNLAMKCLPTSFDDPEGSFMSGVQIAHNLAYLLRKNFYKHLIHFSSSEVYGTAIECPMSEKHPTSPITPYGSGKLAADHMLLSYHKLFNCKISIIRPFNLIGPRQNWSTYAAIVPLTIRRILNGEAPIIRGDGFQTRDFTNVKEVADIIPTLLESDALVGKVVNVGQGKETTILEIIGLVCQELDCPFEKVLFEPARPADVRRHCADATLAKELIGFTPKTNLKETVHQTVEWYKKSEWNVKK